MRAALRRLLGLKNLAVLEFFRDVSPYLRRYRALVLLGVLLSVAASAGEVGFVQLVRRIFNLPLQAPGEGVLRTLLLLSAGVFGVKAAQAVLSLGGSYLLIRVSQKFVEDLRNDLFEAYQRMHLEFFHRDSKGSLASRLTTDVSQVQTILPDLGYLLERCFTIAGLFGFCFWIQPRLTLALAGVLLLALVPFWWLGGLLRERARDNREAQASIQGKVLESIDGALVIRALQAERWMADRFAALTRSAFHARMRMALTGHGMRFGVLAGIAVLMGGMIHRLGINVVRGRLEPADMATYLLAFTAALPALSGFTQLVAIIQEMAGHSRKLFDAFREVPPPRPSAPRRFPERVESLAFEEVTHEYPSGYVALQGVTFRLEFPASAALVGLSGAGKTSFLHLIPRFWDPRTGRILINGTDVREFDLAELRKRISVVPQEPFLFKGTLYDNIVYGQERVDRPRFEKAVESSFVSEFAARLPAGLETMLGDGVALSPGQRQRVSLARALLRDTPIVLLDEPASSLDAESQTFVYKAVERLLGDRLVFLITHDLQMSRHVDRVLLLDRGRLLDQGSHEELARRTPLYRDLLELQSSLELRNPGGKHPGPG